MEKNLNQSLMTPPGLILGSAPIILDEYNYRMAQLLTISGKLGNGVQTIQGIRTMLPSRSSKVETKRIITYQIGLSDNGGEAPPTLMYVFLFRTKNIVQQVVDELSRLHVSNNDELEIIQASLF